MRGPALATIGLFVFFSVSTALTGEVSGPFANKLTQADVVQIKTAVSKERSIVHNVKKIEAIRMDKVNVRTYARTGVDEDTYYDFAVNKRSGAWVVDLNSLQTSIEKRDLRTHGPDIIR